MHLLKTASVLTVSIVWSSMVVCLGASLLHPRPCGASTQSGHEKSTRSSISNDLERSLRAPVSRGGSIDKRGNDLNLALASFEPGELLVPIQVAAEVLQAFYTGIANSAHGPWANNTPRIWIRMTTGTIGLLMTATEGTTIPWDFVTWFALQMLRYTERGYTGLYNAQFVNPTVGNAIWVSLYQCAIGPLADPTGIGAPGKVASCLNANAQAWFPTRKRPRVSLI
ncbi:MAG: hypothetical protein Q9175_006962 [Cornicularia normoerica]